MMTETISTLNTRPRDVQTTTIGNETIALRSRSWERLKFEIEYSLQKGTTANSYLICGEKTALIDPPGESFTEIFLTELKQHLDLNNLNYIILGHVNPNRMATLKALLELATQAKIVCSRPAANAIETNFPEWENRIESVKGDDSLDLGKGHLLQFISTPTPRWADGMCTYDTATEILYTDKLFGVHWCDDRIYDDNWKQLDDDRRYYFDCLHAPQAKQVETALEKLEEFPTKYYAPNHGSIVRYSVSRLGFDYHEWCQEQTKRELRVALLYASAYGNTAIMAGAIAQGLVQSGITVESINCEYTTPEAITTAVNSCDGFIIGSPTLGGHAPIQIQTALGIILSSVPKTKLAAVFGSYGWSGEATDLLEGKLKDANYPFGFNTLKIKFSPTNTILQECEDAGAEFAQKLKKSRKLTAPRQAVTVAGVDRTEQAAGKIIGSLCVVSTPTEAFLTSWVSQASFNPPGLSLAIPQERAVNIGDKFVLNILKEGRNLRRNFSYQSKDIASLKDVTTKIAENECIVLAEALAYLECTVQNRMECGEHWLVYATIDRGEMLQNEGITAIQRRKSGSQY
jgi:flavorubredoxin/flavin reductase (DIM6/NTAB) family NADH-FMN oxidoreductase RutF